MTRLIQFAFSTPTVPTSGRTNCVGSESGRTYRLDRLIGRGGCGDVYLATSTPSSVVPSQVCGKISDRISGFAMQPTPRTGQPRPNWLKCRFATETNPLILNR